MFDVQQGLKICSFQKFGPRRYVDLDWVQFEWKPKEPKVDTVEITSYCPDATYTEFNGGACNDPSSTYSCTNTAKQNYNPDMNQCKNKYNISSNNYDNTDFYSLIYQAWENSKPYLKTMFIKGVV